MSDDIGDDEKVEVILQLLEDMFAGGPISAEQVHRFYVIGELAYDMAEKIESMLESDVIREMDKNLKAKMERMRGIRDTDTER